MENLIFFIILLVVVLTGGGIFLFSRKQKQMREQMVERGKAQQLAQEHAVWAGGEVRSIRQVSGGYDAYGKVILEINFEITGMGEMYHTMTRWLVDAVMLPQIQPGMRLSVKVDRDDPSIAYPNITGARYLP